MTDPLYLALCYDVTNNPRRARLNTRLKGYLTPVQKSVFEGPLPRARWSALQQMVIDTIDASTDTVRVYRFCPRCRIHTILMGTSVVVDEDNRDVII